MKKITARDWQNVRDRMTHTTDALKMPIDSGILETVIVLNVLGFETRASCEGRLDHGIAAPWIDIVPANMQSLGKQLRAVSLQAHPDSKPGQYNPSSPAEKEVTQQIKMQQQELVKALVVYLDAFYQQRHVPYIQHIIPCSWGIFGSVRLASLGSETQDIASAEDKRHNLLLYQAEMHAFTDFLKQSIVIVDDE